MRRGLPAQCNRVYQQSSTPSIATMAHRSAGTQKGESIGPANHENGSIRSVASRTSRRVFAFKIGPSRFALSSDTSMDIAIASLESRCIPEEAPDPPMRESLLPPPSAGTISPCSFIAFRTYPGSSNGLTSPTFLHNPRSVNFRCPLESISMLSGLKSRDPSSCIQNVLMISATTLI